MRIILRLINVISIFPFDSVNSEYLTPLDVAVMTNNIPLAKMLLGHGAKENPLCKFVTW